MGLADALFAGFGQGLGSAMDAYTAGQQHQSELETRRLQQVQSQRALAADTVAAQQQAAYGSASNGDYKQAASLANQIPALYDQAHGTNIASTMRPIVGSPVAAGTYGPGEGPLGSEATGPYSPPTQDAADAIPAHNNFAGPLTQAAIQAHMLMPRPKVELKEVGPGGILVPINAATGMPIAGATPTVNPNQKYSDEQFQHLMALQASKNGANITINAGHDDARNYNTDARYPTDDQGNPIARPTGKPGTVLGVSNISPGIQQYVPLIQHYANQFGVDPRLALLVMSRRENAAGNPMAVGNNVDPKTGKVFQHDVGLMQVGAEVHTNPATGRPYTVQELQDPETNIRAGMQVLADSLKAHPGNLRAGVNGYNGQGPNGNYADPILSEFSRLDSRGPLTRTWDASTGQYTTVPNTVGTTVTPRPTGKQPKRDPAADAIQKAAQAIMARQKAAQQPAQPAQPTTGGQ